MKTIIISFVILLVTFSESVCQQRMIAARDEFHVSVLYNTPIGPKTIGVEPSLLANMEPGLSVDVHYMTTLSRNLQLGGWVGFAGFDDWTVSSNSLYSGTSMTFLSAGPSILYKPGSAAKSLNKLKLVVLLSPGISRISIDTGPDSDINGNFDIDPLTVESLRFTISVHPGLQYMFTNSIGLTFSVGYQYTVADSDIFPDKNFSYVNLRTGVFYRLFKDKRYKYSGL